MIYFLIVNYYSASYIEKLIVSLMQTDAENYQIIIVNNSPDDIHIQELVTHYPLVVLLETRANLGFGGGCNVGLQYIYKQDKHKQDKQAIAWMINPDTYVRDSVVALVQEFFQDYPDVSILGTQTLTPDGEIWFGGGIFNHNTGEITSTDLFADAHETVSVVDCDWISGCSLIVNLAKFTEPPQFDPEYFLYYEDFDFCRRYALAGHRICFTNKISIYHEPSSITNKYIFRKIKNSTYGYLLTLERYGTTWVWGWRSLRLFLYAIVLIPIQPKTAFGKFYGMMIYFYRRFQKVKLFSQKI